MCFVFGVGRSITQSYYRNSVGVVLVFDICQRASFEHIPTWMMEARRSIEPRAPTFVLVGSKADQERRREVRVELIFSIAHIEAFGHDWLIKYITCCANFALLLMMIFLHLSVVQYRARF